MALPTTYRSFVDAIEALSITGVNRQYTQGRPDGAPSTADCPAQWVIFVGGNERSLVFGSQGGRRGMRAEFWVAMGPVAQNTGEENFDDGVDMMDNVSSALQDSTCITKAHLEWDIDLVIRTIAGIDYWVVVTVIRGNG